MQRQGNATLCVGKWHLGGDEIFHHMKQGFDEYHGMPFNYDHSTIFMDGIRIIEEKKDLSQVTRRYTEKVIEFIKRRKDTPFSVYLTHICPHLPNIPNPNFKEKSKVGDYGDVIEEIDWSTSEILKTLKELGLDDNTIVIFTSDNEPAPVFARKYQSAGRLRGSKFTSWEGGQRELCIVRWPGRVPAGQTSSELLCSID